MQIAPFKNGVECWPVPTRLLPRSNGPARNLGSEIKRLRHAVGYSQEALADIVGVDERQIRVLEQGDHTMSIHTLHLVAVALGTNLSDIFGDVGF